MKDKQLSNIESGFKTLLKALEEKRGDLTNQLTQKYEREIKELKVIEGPLVQKQHKLNGISQVLKGIVE